MSSFTFATPKTLHYWIIGAAGGIGKALCKELHAAGATLTISGRKEEGLLQLQAELGVERCHVKVMDVTQAEALTEAAREISPDSVVMLAATYRTPEMTAELSAEHTKNIIDVNLTGTFYVISAAMAVFKEKGRGQLALCASVAGYSGLPAGQPYSATKAGIINVAESLRAEHAGSSIDIKMINPGFVKTDLTDLNDFPMPMIITPEKAGKALAKGLTRNVFEIHFPKRFTYIMKFLRILPYSLYIRLAKHIKP